MSKIDLSILEKFGRKAPMVEVYIEEYNKVIDFDEELGDVAAKGAAFMREVAENHPDAVAKANAVIEQIQALDDVSRAVVVHTITTNRELRKHLKNYVETNQPKVEEVSLSNERIAQIWTDRSSAQQQALFIYKSFQSGFLTKEELDLLPTPPEGKRGAAPGVKRGAMGRKLPSTVSWIIDNEEVGVKSGAEAAKLIGCKAADLRIAIENAYPDATPANFTVTVNDKEVHGTVVVDDPTHPDTSSDEDDTPDGEVGDFDFDVDDLDTDD